jgi:hypothetical protein
VQQASVLKGWIGAGLALLVFSVRPAFAGDSSCKGLSAVKAAELLALPELAVPEYSGFTQSCNYPPPGVSCDSTDYGPTSKICEQRVAVTQDHILGGARRIIATHSLPPRSWPSDGVYVFGCVAGQIKAVYDGYCQPESDAKAEYENLLRDCRRGDNCDNLSSEASSSRVSCKGLKTMSADDLTAIPTSSKRDFFDQGTGCQKLEEDQSGCTWWASVREDRALPNGRRLIIVNRNCESCTGNEDYVFVFGCVAERVRRVFDRSFGPGVEIIDASADNLTLSASDWRERDAHCCPSGIKVMKFGWDEELQSYILRGLQFKKMSVSH